MRNLDLSQPFVWLLQLGWPAGQVLRRSDRPVVVDVTATGGALAFEGGMPAVRWRWEAPLFDVAIGQGSLAIDLDLGPDAPGLAARRPMEGARAELALHRPGQPYEARQVVLRARVTRAVWGAPGQLVSIELDEELGDDTGMLFDETWVITTDDWADARDDAVGQPYPAPLGMPGVIRTTDGTLSVAGTPVHVVRLTTPTATDPITAVIAGGQIPALQVTILCAGTGISAERDVDVAVMRADGELRPYATVNLYPITDFNDSGAGLIADIDTDDFYAIWTYGGATSTTDQSRGLLGAGEILEWALRRSTLRIDWARVAAARAWLDAYQVDTYLNEGITAWEWIRRVLVPMLPMSLTSGPDGVFPVLWRLDAEPHEAVVHLEVGRNCARASRDEPGDQDLYVEAQVGFGPDDADDGALQRTVTMGADEGDGGDRGTCLWSAHLAQDYEEAQAPTYNTGLDQTHDADTAWLHAIDVITRGRRGRLIELDVRPELAGLEQGDVALVTDAGRGWRGKVAIVQAVEIASAYIRVGLWISYQ